MCVSWISPLLKNKKQELGIWSNYYHTKPKSKIRINALGCAKLLKNANKFFTPYIMEFAKVYPKTKKVNDKQ